MKEQVCAVVVSYNRKALLLECLDAIFAQTRPVERILLIDNASTDGTPDLLREKGYLDNRLIEYLRLPTNIGGAGGFHEGMKWAFNKGFDWIWVMDDDSIAEPSALAELFIARQQFDEEQCPRLLASKVVWVDETLHPMNVPRLKSSGYSYIESLFLAAQNSMLSIRSTSFVSLLLHRTLIQQYGLPIADYFIWTDDVEYTGRILRNEFGVVVPSSIVRHKTVEKYAPTHTAGFKHYYGIRNTMWMIIRSSAWSGKEKVQIAGSLLDSMWRMLVQSRFSWSNVRFITLGIVDGVFKTPKL